MRENIRNGKRRLKASFFADLSFPYNIFKGCANEVAK
jgi:hypothetical protein